MNARSRLLSRLLVGVLVTTSVVGLRTSVGYPDLDTLGPWTWPSDLWTLITDEDEDQATIRTNGGFLVIEPTYEGGNFRSGLGPSVAFESVGRYNLLGSDPLFFRFRLHDYESAEVEPDASFQMELIGVDSRVTARVNASGDPKKISFHFQLTEPSGSFPFFTVVYNQTVTVDYDPDLHRWVRLAHDPDLGKIRWEAGGETWATVHETDEPSNTDWLTAFGIEFSIIQAFSGGGISEDVGWIGPLNEVPQPQSTLFPTTIDPLPIEGPESVVHLLNQVGDDPPNPDGIEE